MDVIGQDGYSLLESYNASGVMKNCTKCKQPILKGQRRVIIDWHEGNEYQHADCMAVALARAEAAERRVAELEARLAELVTGPGGFNERADIIKELRAQLAAQAWRPVTEPPQMADNYHVWRRPGYHDFCHFNGVNWRTTGGDSVTHWQPLPAPPID